MDDAFFRAVDGVSQGVTCTGTPEWDAGVQGRDNLIGNSQQTDEYCGLSESDDEWHRAYPRWSEVPTYIYFRISYASIVGLGVQWGTTGR